MKRILTAILTIVMVVAVAGSAFASVPGTLQGDKLTASVIVGDQPAQFLFDNGYSYDADEIGAKLPGVTATVGVTGDNIPSVTFAGSMLSTDLSEQFPNVPGTAWDSAYIAWYVLVPEGATYVDYTTATSSTGVNPILLGDASDPGTNMDGQTVLINGSRYLRVLGQFAARSPGGVWGITYGQSKDDIPSMATFPMQFGTKTGETFNPVGGLLQVRNIYDDSFQIVEPAAEIVLNWATGDGITSPVNGVVNATAGRTFRIGVNLQNTGSADLANALVVMTITKSGAPVMSGITINAVTGADSTLPIGVDAAGSFYYWGPRTGFTVTQGWDKTTMFDVSFADAGTYDVEIYVVRLNAE